MSNKNINIPLLNRPLVILGLLCIMYCFSFFHRACIAVLSVDIMNDFAMTTANIGLIGSATMLGYALSQVPTGIFTDRFGARKTLFVYQILAGISAICFAYSTDWKFAVASRFVLGLTIAVNVPALKHLALWLPAAWYSKASSILLTFATVGTFLASTPLAFASSVWGWKFCLVAVGVATIALALTALFGLKDRPENQILASHEPERKISLSVIFSKIVRVRNFWLLFIWFLIMVGNLYVLFTMWWGTYLMQGVGLDKNETGLCLSIMAICSAIAMPLFAVLSDNILHSRKKILVIGSVVASLLLSGLCFGFTGHSVPALAFISACLNIAFVAPAPMVFTMAKESLPEEVIGTAFGILNFGAPIYASIIQWIFGLVVNSGMESGNTILESYSSAFIMILAFTMIGFVATFFMKDTFTSEECYADLATEKSR
ncbi:major facilitator superfamily MFS_1 [Pseudodesulfovibrio mercurii]|uniref:Lysosomal dipeptide transporter MFSD1 n=1 Tax=Pseudodesulfovibrio mercurii TaxID=641491 RepID=F0JIC4_9BACT|nr:MFS transporter [Pseudodesulfovibrio mercurii]EGB14176.1 major facilitator superfamily MFS_1 [Pseudodesulfovibrio mercurii]